MALERYFVLTQLRNTVNGNQDETNNKSRTWCGSCRGYFSPMELVDEAHQRFAIVNCVRRDRTTTW